MTLLSLALWCAPVLAATAPPKDSGGDTGIYDTGGDTGDTGSVVVVPPTNTYDGHLDGELAYQMAGDNGGCATLGSRTAAVALPLVLVGLAVGRLRRPRR